MEQVITIRELANMAKSNGQFSCTEKEIIFILRASFDIINAKLNSMEEGKLKIQNFGNLLIRNGETLEGEKIIRYSYRPAPVLNSNEK